MALSTTALPKELNLNSYMEFLQLSPLSFNNLDVQNCVVDYVEQCKNFNQFPYNDSNFISREQIATQIALAKQRVENELGFPIVPTYITNEELPIPAFFDTTYSLYPDLRRLKFLTKNKNILDFGQRRLTSLGLSPLTGVDTDGDGINEYYDTTYVVPLIVGVTDTIDICKLKAYYPTHVDDPIYDVRFSVQSFNPLTRTVVVRFHFYDLIQEQYIWTTGFSRVRSTSLCNNDITITQIAFAYEDISPCLPDITVHYFQQQSNGLFCSGNCEGDCTEITVPACGKILDSCMSMFSLTPMMYDNTGCVVEGNMCICGRPAKIKVNYLAGSYLQHQASQGDTYLFTSMYNSGQCGRNYNHQLIEAVFMLATANLQIALCNCGCLLPKIQQLQQDYAYRDKSSSWSKPYRQLDNPFGTKEGEFKAYQLIEAYKSSILC